MPAGSASDLVGRLGNHRRWATSAMLLALALHSGCERRASDPQAQAEGAPERDSPAAAKEGSDSNVSSHLARSIAREKQGDLSGALEAAKAAIEAGEGRDATVQAAKVAILMSNYDQAASWLEPLVKDNPDDAVAQYNLGLVRHQQGDYNRARNGYLAALRADPRHADARYNLAVLTHRHGVTEEAKHHVTKFRSTFPDDPRGPELERLVGGKGAAGPDAPDATPPKRR